VCGGRFVPCLSCFLVNKLYGVVNSSLHKKCTGPTQNILHDFSNALFCLLLSVQTFYMINKCIDSFDM